MIKTSIIILNYNTASYSEKLIESINEHLNLNECEVILADNNSKDKSFRKISNRFPFIRIIEFDNNLGFATGNNKATEYAKGEYLLFLNPDVIIRENNLNILRDYLETHPDVGIVSGLMVDIENKPIYCYNSFPTIEWELFQFLGFGYDYKIKKLLSRKEIEDNSTFEVDWFHGAFILTSKNNFKAVNGFNEDHFMYYEDVELCYSLKNKLGLKNVCIPKLRYIHHTRATFCDVSKDDIYYFHINRGKLIFIQNYSFIRRNLLKLISFGGVIIRILLLPFWKKYRKIKKSKFIQLLKISRLHISRKYLFSSKYEFIMR